MVTFCKCTGNPHGPSPRFKYMVGADIQTEELIFQDKYGERYVTGETLECFAIPNSFYRFELELIVADLYPWRD